MNSVLLYFSLKYKGNWEKIYRALDTKEAVTKKELEEAVTKIDSDFVTILNSEYPSYLKNSFKPPFILFFKGDISLLKDYHKTVAIIGGEETNEFDKQNIERLSKKFIEEGNIISTIENKGVNEEVLDVALKNNNKLVLILKSDMKSYDDKTVNFKERKNFLALTEVYEFEKNQEYEIQDYYPNRILSGISNELIFMPHKEKDKIHELFTLTKKDGKEVFQIPDNIKDFEKTTENKWTNFLNLEIKKEELNRKEYKSNFQKEIIKKPGRSR